MGKPAAQTGQHAPRQHARIQGIKAACDWAYKGASEGSTLEYYFDSSLPIVNLRLAQGGVHLAATLKS
ncbi:hypothetical protein Dsin_028789 [Dipteronia sinensis]|uniref:Aspergillus nuclease S1 n=1 Tax=Dipteronia sinensis TaxID=43782 RepID=A0AAD9ZRD6_9ROSI|nr:hypothetical protein Dsin_028789 [Dipteronia sinensis]